MRVCKIVCLIIFFSNLVFTEAQPPVVQPSPVSTQTPKPELSATPLEDNEVVQIDTEEVILNVRVIDTKNRSVTDLNVSQFQIYEDNVLQPITFFVKTEVPLINALVIDNSRSLRAHLDQVIEAGKIFTATNLGRDQSCIIRFVGSDKINIVQDFTSNQPLLYHGLDNLFVEGGQTAIIDAIFQAAGKVDQYQKTETKENAIIRSLIVISDGNDLGSTHTEQELFQMLRTLNVQIYAIGFINNLTNELDLNVPNHREKAKSFLVRLAEETGGKTYFPAETNELADIAKEISGELRKQYLISFSPQDTIGNSYKTIRVVVADGPNNEKRTAITRNGRATALGIKDTARKPDK